MCIRDRRVDVGDVQAVLRDLRAVRLDREAGLPSSRTRVMSVMPGTAAITLRTASALASSVSRSDPKILTASELLRPVSASSTASSAGCVKLKMMPGNALSLSLIADVSWGLVRMAPCHAGSLYGLSPTKY